MNALKIAQEFHLTPLHPACVTIGTLRERVEELERQIGRPLVMERGPWIATKDGRKIVSDDFTHDAELRVTGDFADDAERFRYAQEIARRLNAERSELVDPTCPRCASERVKLSTLIECRVCAETVSSELRWLPSQQRT